MLKERGTAVLFSTHITSDLEKCADDIIYILEGRMIAASTVEAFRGYYSNYGDTLEAIMLRLEREARYA